MMHKKDERRFIFWVVLCRRAQSFSSHSIRTKNPHKFSLLKCLLLGFFFLSVLFWKWYQFWIPNPNSRTDKKGKRGKERGQNRKCSSDEQGAVWEVGEQLVEHGQQCMIRNSPGERATERWWVCWTVRLIGWLFCKRWVSYRVKELERVSGRAAEAGQCIWSHDTLHDALHAPTANAASNLKTIPLCTATQRLWVL